MKNSKVIDLKTRKEVQFVEDQFDKLNISQSKRSVKNAPRYFKERDKMIDKVDTMLSAVIRDDTDGFLAWSVLAEKFAYILLPDARELMANVDKAEDEEARKKAYDEIERVLEITDAFEDFQLRVMATYLDELENPHKE